METQSTTRSFTMFWTVGVDRKPQTLSTYEQSGFCVSSQLELLESMNAFEYGAKVISQKSK